MGLLSELPPPQHWGTLCLVCGYDLGFSAWVGAGPSNRQCPSCGLHFGQDDVSQPGGALSRIRWYQWRLAWVVARMPWHGTNVQRDPPSGWDPVVQLHRVGVDLGSSFAAWSAAHPPVDLAHVPQWTAIATDHLEALGQSPAAIEAQWDGDTQGWGVCVLAVLATSSEGPRAYEARPLIFLRAGGDLRLFNQEVPPWPEALVAEHVGRTLAERYDVPFYFPSSTAPDDDTPHWWEQEQAASCPQCGKPIVQPYTNGLCYNCSIALEAQRRDE